MSASPFDLDGRIALVTGGGSGLGLAIARGLADAGARVAINGRNRAKLDAAAAVLADDGINVRVVPFDVTDEAAVAAGVAALERDLGGVDILVNNAAVNQRQPFEQFSLEQWRTVQGANVDGPFLVTRALLPAMKAQRRGKIVNICSIASDLGRPDIVAYATSKGALKMMTRALAVELAPFNVQVNGIAPGFFKTEMNAPLIANAEFSAWVEKRTPAGRWGDPAEIAGAAVFLCSPAANYVSGDILHVDGGFTAAY
ncbi:MAG: glucose 1-dehydrogenase [Casimicrobiaceae bacterium]